MKTENDDSAFPHREYESRPFYHGLTKREYFAAHAPIEYEEVARVFGDEITTDDLGRAAFFAVRALLAKEYADALIDALNEHPTHPKSSTD